MSAPIRVFMPMLTLVPGEMGGSETAARELLLALADRDDVRVEVAVASSAAGSSPAGVTEVVARGLTAGGSTVDRLRTVGRALTRPGAAAEPFERADIAHFAFSVPAPRPPRGLPVVQTLYDVQHHDLPALFSRAERSYRRWAYDAPARSADAVLTTSDFSRDRIVAALAVDAARVHVAPLGVTQRPDPVRRDPGDYVLYPARAWPHKNHDRLVRAMQEVRRIRPGLRLVLTGGDLDRIGPLPHWVEARGHVTDEELVHLYEGAACLAFPSIYEGFGLPPLEAMSLGCPVAAANAGSLPEVCGEAAVLFDPKDISAIAAGIVRAMEDRERFVAAGVRRARQFTWEGCADAHVEVYRAIRPTVRRVPR